MHKINWSSGAKSRVRWCEKRGFKKVYEHTQQGQLHTTTTLIFEKSFHGTKIRVPVGNVDPRDRKPWADNGYPKIVIGDLSVTTTFECLKEAFKQDDKRQRSKIISYEEWEKTYKPISKDGETLHDFDPRIVENSHQEFIKAIDAHRLWTRLDSDDFVVLSGMHYVNRLEHYITEVPYNEEIEVFEEIEMS